MNSYIISLLLAGGEVYVNVNYRIKTSSGRRGRAFGVSIARFFSAENDGFYDINNTIMF